MGSAKPKTSPDRQLRVGREEGKSDAQRLVDISLNPSASASATVLLFNKGTFGESGLTETYEALAEEARKVHGGVLTGPEALLVSQAHSLNAIFIELCRRLTLNMGEYLDASEKYMRLALKAQKVDMKRLSGWLGHSTIALTLDRYGHLIQDEQQDAAIMAAAQADLLG
jgi:hypothetical protein